MRMLTRRLRAAARRIRLARPAGRTRQTARERGAIRLPAGRLPRAVRRGLRRLRPRYPRPDRTGIRRWLPSPRQILLGCVWFVLALAGLIGYAYERTAIPSDLNAFAT